MHLNNRFSNNFVDTFLWCKFSKHLIKLIGIWVPIVLPKFQPFELESKQRNNGIMMKPSTKQNRMPTRQFKEIISSTILKNDAEYLWLQFHTISKIWICFQLLSILRS